MALILFSLVLIYNKSVLLKKKVCITAKNAYIDFELTLSYQLLHEQDPYVPIMVDCTLCYGSIDSRAKRCKFCSVDNPLAKAE